MIATVCERSCPGLEAAGAFLTQDERDGGVTILERAMPEVVRPEHSRLIPNVAARVATLGAHVLDFMFQPRCVGCGREGAHLCILCLGQATPLPLPYFPDNAGGPNACLVSSIYLSGVLSCYALEGAVREAVHEMKYKGLPALAPALGEALADQARQSGLRFDAITSVPLHPKRLRQRGYN